jgi:hypothetical protein
MFAVAALVVLIAASLCVLLWRSVIASVRARWPQEQAPETLALDLTELVVVAGLTTAAVVVGGDVILDPSRWAAPGSTSVQTVVALAVGYLVVHLAGVLRYGGARSLVVHHVVLIAGFTFTLAVDGYHGYVLVTLIGTATSMLRDLTGLAKRGYLRIHRTAVAIAYVIFETFPALAIPLQFFAYEIPRGELSSAAVWVGSIAFPIVAAIGLFSVAQVLRRLAGKRRAPVPPTRPSAAAEPVAGPSLAGPSLAGSSLAGSSLAGSSLAGQSLIDAAASSSHLRPGASGRLREIAATSGRWLADAAASSGAWLPLEGELPAPASRHAAPSDSSGSRPVVV